MGYVDTPTPEAGRRPRHKLLQLDEFICSDATMEIIADGVQGKPISYGVAARVNEDGLWQGWCGYCARSGRSFMLRRLLERDLGLTLVDYRDVADGEVYFVQHDVAEEVCDCAGEPNCTAPRNFTPDWGTVFAAAFDRMEAALV